MSQARTESPRNLCLERCETVVAAITRGSNETSSLVVSNRHQAFADGLSLQKDNTATDQSPKDYQSSVVHKSIVTLGNLTYISELYELSPEEDRRQLIASREKDGVTEAIPDFFLSPTPSADTERWREHDIHRRLPKERMVLLHM